MLSMNMIDEGLPLAHKAAQLVSSEVHAPEVGQAVLALHVLNAQLDFAERLVLVLSRRTRGGEAGARQSQFWWAQGLGLVPTASRPATRLVQVRQGRLDDTALESLGRDLGARGARDQRLANLAVGEHDGRLHVIPVLPAERVLPAQNDEATPEQCVCQNAALVKSLAGRGRDARPNP